VPATVMHSILGSLGGALSVAAAVGGARGAELAHAARAAFMSGNELALAVGAAAAIGAALLVLAALPTRTTDRPPEDDLGARPGPPAEEVVASQH